MTKGTIVQLKTSRDYIRVEQCDLDFEDQIRAAYAVNGPVVSIICEFREQIIDAAGRKA